MSLLVQRAAPGRTRRARNRCPVRQGACLRAAGRNTVLPGLTTDSRACTCVIAGPTRGPAPVTPGSTRGLAPVTPGSTRGRSPLHAPRSPVKPGMTPVKPGMTPVKQGMTPVKPRTTPVKPRTTPLMPVTTAASPEALSPAPDAPLADLHGLCSAKPDSSERWLDRRFTFIDRDLTQAIP